MEEIFKNIEEQRLWNNETMWSNDGHEWSKSFGTTENLWNNHIFDDIKEFRDKKIALFIQNSVADQKYYSVLTSIF